MHPAAAALLLACGLQQQDSSSGSSSYVDCIPPGRRLEALLRLMYSFDVWELLPPAASAATGSWQQQQQQLEPAWQSAPARWAATVLTQQICQQVLGESPAASAAAAVVAETQQQQQQQQQQLDDVYPCQMKTLLQGANGVSPQPQQQQQQQQQLFPTWSAAPAAAQVVDRLVVDLSDVSFGDPLFGAHVAMLLLPAAGVRLQRACWRALMDHR
jgi:hypothetical protein